MPVEHLLLGSQIETMNETELAAAASATSVLPGWPRLTRNASSMRSRVRPCVGIPGRWHQRRPGLEGRRCRYLGGQRGRHCQGVIRYSSCWKTACWYWSRACWKDGGCSATLSNTSRWQPARTSATCSASWGPARSCLSLPMLPIQVLTNKPPVRLLADHHPHR